MIEVEKKFILTDEERQRLIRDAKFLGEKSFTDIYFDDSSYSLSTKDLWLRQRSGKYELKVPINVPIENRVSDQYRELETDEEIMRQLNLAVDMPLAEALRDRGYVPFITLTTTRKKYRKDGYSIDLDSTDFDYHIAEIESMVDDESKIREAADKIIEYAKNQGITSDNVVRGKVAEYLRRNDQAHFQALIKAGVIK